MSTGANSVPLVLPAASGAKLAVFAYGQSLSIGAKGSPPLSTTQLYENKMFSGGLWPGYTIPDYESLAPLVEETQETICSGMVNSARTRAVIATGEDPSAVEWLAAALGKGSTVIADLAKSTQHYADIMNKAIPYAFSLDPDRKMVAMAWLQGESDQAVGTTYAAYRTALEDLLTDFEADVKAANGQPEPVYCLTYQTARMTRTRTDVAMAQLDLAREHDRFHFVSPIYFLPHDADGLHLINVGYRWLGGYYGRALDELTQGSQPQWLCPRSATLRGNVVTLRLDVPTLPLVFDTTTIPQTDDYGFAVVADGVAQAIDGIEIGGATVRITLDTVPAGAVRLRYAMDATAPGLPIAAEKSGTGNLRDSASDTIMVDGVDRPLANWSPHFDLPVCSVEA